LLGLSGVTDLGSVKDKCHRHQESRESGGGEPGVVADQQQDAASHFSTDGSDQQEFRE
jgi:hypothetical protein